MAPKTKARPAIAISQEGFDAAVKENMEDFDMDLAEAVEDAVKTFQIQGADLSDIGSLYSMAGDELPKTENYDQKDLEPSLEPPLEPETDVKDAEPPLTGDTNVPDAVVVDFDVSPLAKDEDVAHDDNHNNNLDNVVEPLVEPKETVVAKDEISEHPLAEPGNPEQAGSGATDVVQPQLAQPDNREHVEPSVARIEDAATAGIVTDGTNIGKADYVHPVVEALKELDKSLLLLRLEDESYINWEHKQTEPQRVENLFEASVEALEKVAKLCSKNEPENCQIAVKYGGVETSIQAYYALQTYRMSWSSVAFKVLFNLIAEEPGKEAFLKANGPQVVLEALAIENIELYEPMNRELSCIAANTLALAAGQNESVKNTFMDLGADEALVKYLKNHSEEMGSDGAALQAACDAIRSLTVADDERPAASNAFKNAMKIAKAGAMEAFLEILPQKSKALPILPSLCLTLKSLAVNDEICRDFADEGGLGMVLDFLDYACKYPNKVVGRTSCALLAQLAGSDANKEEIVNIGGLQKIFTLMKSYNEEPSVLQEGCAAIATLTLRSPQHVTKAVEAGALDVAAEVMEAHPNAPHMLRQACQMVRNLNVRNPENRPISLEKGLEPLLRQAKDTHEICQDVASAALRDIGIEDYL